MKSNDQDSFSVIRQTSSNLWDETTTHVYKGVQIETRIYQPSSNKPTFGILYFTDDLTDRKGLVDCDHRIEDPSYTNLNHPLFDAAIRK